MSPRRYQELAEAENLLEDLGILGLAAERDDDRFAEGTTEDFLAAVDAREP